MEFDRLIKAFAEQMGAGDMSPEDGGHYLLTFDGRLNVRCLRAGKEKMIISGKVGELPQDERQTDDFLRRLLHINLARMKNQKEVLSIEPEDGRLILFRPVATEEMSVERIMDIMEGFLENMEFWCDTAGEQPKTAPHPFFPMMFP